LPDGRGYLVKSDLPSLSAKETYQLWGVVGGQPISIGILGRNPGQVTFTFAGSPSPSQLGINVEPAGGSVGPSSPMLEERAICIDAFVGQECRWGDFRARNGRSREPAARADKGITFSTPSV